MMTLNQLVMQVRGFRRHGILTRDEAAQLIADTVKVNAGTALRILGSRRIA